MDCVTTKRPLVIAVTVDVLHRVSATQQPSTIIYYQCMCCLSYGNCVFDSTKKKKSIFVKSSKYIIGKTARKSHQCLRVLPGGLVVRASD